MKSIRTLKMNQLISGNVGADFHEVRIENGRADRNVVLNPPTPQIQSHMQPLTVAFEERHFSPRLLQQPKVSVS
jgi:hypothetical protein